MFYGKKNFNSILFATVCINHFVLNIYLFILNIKYTQTFMTFFKFKLSLFFIYKATYFYKIFKTETLLYSLKEINNF